jgi:hypothetical protein
LSETYISGKFLIPRAGEAYNAGRGGAIQKISLGLSVVSPRGVQHEIRSRGWLFGRTSGNTIRPHSFASFGCRSNAHPHQQFAHDIYRELIEINTVTSTIRYKQEGFKPDRDIIVALETDEEIGDRDAVGIQWLIKNHRDLIDAEFALNEGGGVGLRNGEALRNSIQTSEKVFVDYIFEVKNSGGHSSQPSKDNAIYHLAGGLTRLGQFDFPIKLNETTSAWLKEAAPFEDKQIGADMLSVASGHPDPAAVARLSALPPYNAQLRTTCVATLLEAGHADNALPQKAQAQSIVASYPVNPSMNFRRLWCAWWGMTKSRWFRER